jgi:hypothetical protein
MLLTRKLTFFCINTDHILIHCMLIDQLKVSLANLRYKVEAENSAYEKSLGNISETSKIITTYELVTVLLIVGAGLGGISEIAKNKMIGYAGLAIGGVGVIILLLFLFIGVTV